MAISNAFFKAAEAQKAEVQKRKPPIKKSPEFIPAKTAQGSSVVDSGITKPLVVIDLELNPARIRLHFSEKPNKEIRQKMKENRFWYHPSDRSWSVPDTQKSRGFINDIFDAKLETNEVSPRIDVEKTAINDPGRNKTPEPIPTPTPEVIVSPGPIAEDVSPELARYRSQVDDLIEYLKCPPADLLLIAIDAYHKQIFSRPN